MGHSINALIGRREALGKLAARLGPPDATALAFDLVIIPLDEERLDAISMSEEVAFDGFTYLKPAMAAEIGDMVGDGRVLYVETEYFGGMGGQSAALFDNGTLIWKDAESTFEEVASQSLLTRLFKPSTVRSKSPISEGLAKLGVVATDGKDEFDQVGLGRYRSLEDLGLEYDD